MDPWGIALGFLGFGLLAEGLFKGRMLTDGHDARRDENPRFFWFLAACYGLMGLAGFFYGLAPLL